MHNEKKNLYCSRISLPFLKIIIIITTTQRLNSDEMWHLNLKYFHQFEYIYIFAMLTKNAFNCTFAFSLKKVIFLLIKNIQKFLYCHIINNFFLFFFDKYYLIQQTVLVLDFIFFSNFYKSYNLLLFIFYLQFFFP